MKNSRSKPRILKIDERVRKALVASRYLEDEQLPLAELSEGDVEAVEKELGCRFPDDVLALFAANSDDLTENAGMELSKVVFLTKEAWSLACPKDLVAIGRQADGHAFYCIEKRTRWEDQAVMLHEFDRFDHSLSRESLGDWLAERVDACREAQLDGDDEEEKRRARSEPTSAQLSSFQPQIVPNRPVEGAAPVGVHRRVRHKTYGVGIVVAERGVGVNRKLEIDFEGLGKKVILARFVDES